MIVPYRICRLDFINFQNIPVSFDREDGVKSSVVIGLFHSVAGILDPAALINNKFVLVTPRRRCFNFGKPKSGCVSRERRSASLPTVKVASDRNAFRRIVVIDKQQTAILDSWRTATHGLQRVVFF